MSTGRRLAKRSIIGTKVCAPGPDGLWYSGVIQDVKTPPTATVSYATNEHSELNSAATADVAAAVDAATAVGGNADTIYIVRFDFKTQTMQNIDSNSSIGKSVIMEARRTAHIHISPAQTLRRNAMIKEFRESDLVGPGFRTIMGIQLQPGQRVFLTYNGRETSGDVISHDAEKDEVVVKITAIGTEEPIELKKRLEEVRLLESRRSARLADQDRDTDFARLADMGGDRRKTSHSIEVPLTLTPQHNSRKRPPSYSHECSDNQCNEEEMNECNAALILMNLSNSPKSPKNGDKWLGSSPGSSSASWSSGSSSPPLSDDGHVLHTSTILNDPSANARLRTTSVSTSDEGIVVDFKEDAPRKRKGIRPRFLCTWKGCNFSEHTLQKIERHIRSTHLGKKPRRSADYDSDHEEEFYYTEIEDEADDLDDDNAKTLSPTSPPTLSHRDMARPPHEDPEYQRQIVGNFKQGRVGNMCQQQQHHNNIKSQHIGTNHNQNQQNQNSYSNISTSPLDHHNYTWSSIPSASVQAAATSTISHSTIQQYNQQSQPQQHSPLIKHSRSSPRPSQSTAPYPTPNYVHHHHHHNYSSNSPNNKSNSNSNSNNNLIIQNSNSNVLHQLSQQNITVTTHHSVNHSHQQQPQQQQQQLSSITITPNYQHNIRSINSQQQSPTTTANNIIATANQSNTSQLIHQQHTIVQHAVTTARQTPNSPNRRTRGENKKCRKVYGMERKEQWCTQCRWKKACSRFGD
ncbi:zinc finger protein 395 [Teleopsis dalmanni]|uniref:zinc finger protein 395 n=1 Tax=Teleopsis dalmanni TaxID=139649 RepID=UPI0018CE6D13|nr:zinc finger protein 395 [Teleopsis dalmanni]